MMRIGIVFGDITRLDCDAIVNAANPDLARGGGVCGAIHRAAGPELEEACRALGGCAVGQAKITGGFRLPARYVIHAVGPVWDGGGNGEREKLRDCYRNALRVAEENGLRTIAFPSISTGIYRFPVEEAAEIATAAVREHIEATPGSPLEKILFVFFPERSGAERYCRILGIPAAEIVEPG